MSCDTFLPLIVRAADHGLDALDPEERGRLATHLEACAECRHALDEQRAVLSVLTGREDVPIPVGFPTRVVAEIETGARWTELFRWQAWTYRLAPVAVGLWILALVASQGVSGSAQSVDVSGVTEAWVLDAYDPEAPPAFTLFWQEAVSADVLLDVVLAADPDEPLVRDPS